MTGIKTAEGKNDMEERKRRYRTARWVFGIVFALSTCFFCVFLTLTMTLSGSPSDPNAATGLDGGGLLALASLLTSITSLLGFVSTTVISWRREKREAEEAELEKQLQELEVERLRLELEQMKAERGE
jgi:hypothetical protein